MEPLTLTKPHLIIMVGIPGSGKSFFADQFAATFKAPIINSENIRTEMFLTPTYSPTEQSLVSVVSNHLLDQILKTNRTAIYRGQTDKRTERAELSKKCRAAGYEPLFIWVQTDADTAKKRLQKSKNAIIIDQFDSQTRKFDQPLRIEKAIVISGKHTYQSQLKIVLRHLIGPKTPEQSARPPINRHFLIR